MIYKRLYNGNVVLRSLCGTPPHPLDPATAATAVANHLHQGGLPPNRLWDIAHVLKQDAQWTVEASIAASARASASASPLAAALPAATTEGQDAGQEDDLPAETGPVRPDPGNTDTAPAATGECVVQFPAWHVCANLPQKLAHHFEAWSIPAGLSDSIWMTLQLVLCAWSLPAAASTSRQETSHYDAAVCNDGQTYQ